MKLYLVIPILTLSSCVPYKKDIPAVKVDEEVLYKSDVQNQIKNYESSEDSLNQARQIIEKWGIQQLLVKQAQVNLNKEQQINIKKKVNEYNLLLWEIAYKDNILKTKLDTLITLKEKKVYYQNNRSNFKLHQNIFKLRYIVISKYNDNIKLLKKNIRLKTLKALTILDSLKFQYEKSHLNDSIWVDQKKLVAQFNFITNENVNSFLKKEKYVSEYSKNFQFILFIDDFIKQGEIAPYSYVENVIKTIILNRRKKEMIKQIDQELLEDALQYNKIQIYD